MGGARRDNGDWTIGELGATVKSAGSGKSDPDYGTQKWGRLDFS